MFKDIPYKQQYKRVGMAVLISDKIDIKIQMKQNFPTNKPGHFTMKKNQSENTIVINTYTSNERTSKYMK